MQCTHKNALVCLGRRDLLRSLGAAVFGLGPLAVLLKTGETEQGSHRKRASMIRLVSDSPSIVLRDTHILLIRIQSAMAHRYGGPAPSRCKSRGDCYIWSEVPMSAVRVGAR